MLNIDTPNSHLLGGIHIIVLCETHTLHVWGLLGRSRLSKVPVYFCRCTSFPVELPDVLPHRFLYLRPR